MKITPIASGSGDPGAVHGDVQIGSSTSPDKKQRAQKAFKGESQHSIRESETPIKPDLSRQHKRVINMKTNATPTRGIPPELMGQETPEAQPQTQNAIPEPNDASQQAPVTKPLSPESAALARQKRALQVKERELAEREARLSQPTEPQSPDWKTQLKSNPLGILQEAGVSYDDLTQAILGKSSQAVDAEAIKADLIKAIKEDLNKDFQARDDQSKKQVLAQMTREANYLVSQGSTYELVGKTDSVKDAIDLIDRTFTKTGEVLDVTEALKLVEEELIEEFRELAKASKVQSLFGPKAPTQQASQAPQGQMRTLTSRDSAGAQQLDRKQRAYLAFHGQLKRG